MSIINITKPKPTINQWKCAVFLLQYQTLMYFHGDDGEVWLADWVCRTNRVLLLLHSQLEGPSMCFC